MNWRNLYKGIGGNLAGVVPACAVFFAVYEPAKRMLLPLDDNKLMHSDRTIAAHLTAAASAGLAASIVRVPTEVVKSRMQTGQFTSARGAVWQIASREEHRWRALRWVRLISFTRFTIRRDRVRILRADEDHLVVC